MMKWIITQWLKWKPPNLKRATRIRRYPLGTKYAAPNGQVYRYLKYGKTR